MSLNPNPIVMRALSSKSLKGIVSIPGDKSISHRSLILSSIAIGKTKISGLNQNIFKIDIKPKKKKFIKNIMEKTVLKMLSYILSARLYSWVEGKIHGKGIFRFSNGSLYDGNFSNDEMNGKGTLM